MLYREKLSESDTRAKLITPALRKRDWTEDLIRREETNGKIIRTSDGRITRGNRKVDYLLSLPAPQTGGQPVPVALIEAKKNTESPGRGMEQAKAYARLCERFNVQFVYSSNGYQFVEYDRTTGRESEPRSMDSFPTPADLQARYAEYLGGVQLDDPVVRPLTTQTTKKSHIRRYYQDAAIRAVLEQLAQQEKAGEKQRALLCLATGAGKTFIAAELLKQLDDAGKMRRALFLCDRDALRQQAADQFHQLFGNEAGIAKKDKNGENHARNARVQIVTYQTLDNDATGTTFLEQNYPRDHFSHIIIDECHRSLRDDWARILSENDSAVHIGLTATPKQIKVDGNDTDEDREISSRNRQYFGEPVYSYDLIQGSEDGYLALCEAQQYEVNIDNRGLDIEQVMALNPINYVTGDLLTEDELKEMYIKRDYENIIMLPDRVREMSHDLFRNLIKNSPEQNPHQKTIIFCARREHAESVTRELNTIYADWCKAHDQKRAEPYAFVCMAENGSDQLDQFRDKDSEHTIAATVDLLATGVDIPSVRNIVFFCYIKSPIRVQQMLGRGARIDINSNKFSFIVYDYTRAINQLEDYDWNPPQPPRTTHTKQASDSGESTRPPIAIAKGLEVQVSKLGNYIMQTDHETGKLRKMDMEEYRARMMNDMQRQVKNLDEFRAVYINPKKRDELNRNLHANGFYIEALAALREMKGYDDYDIIAGGGYGAMPMKRQQRAEAFFYKNADWLQDMPPPAAKVIKALIQQFANNGIEELEDKAVFQTPAVQAAGGLAALRGVTDNPEELLDEAKRRLFVA